MQPVYRRILDFFILHPSSLILRLLISAYQVTLGAHFGGRCRFEPSCSCYGKEAIHTHGTLKGSWLTLKRIAKCAPWHKGGLDPVPQKSVKSAESVVSSSLHS